MNRFGGLYLIRLFRQNKFLFCFVLLFIFFQQYFYLKDNSTFPWFVWSMYSHKEYMPDTMTQTELFINNMRVDITSIPIWQEATIMHTFDKYIELKNNDFTDPVDKVVKKRVSHLSANLQQYISVQIEVKKTDAEKYPEWLINYLRTEVIKANIQTIEFKETLYRFNKNTFRKTDSTKTLLKIDV